MNTNRATHPLAAWLGPALDDLTDDQLDRLTAESQRIDARYPDPDEADLREAALTAAVQYLLGDTTAEDAKRALITARTAEARAYVAALQIAVMIATDSPRSDARAAREVGIDRMRVLEALGKR